MNKCVTLIEDQFTEILKRHEADFMNSYHGHMIKVQKELKFLKKKVNEAHGQILNDDRINGLESQIQWFANEAVILDQILNNQKEIYHGHKDRAIFLAEEREWMKEEVSSIMHYNKTI